MAGCISPVGRMVNARLEMTRCGGCTYCRVRRKQAWVGRLLLERLDHEHARFVTLTYRDAPARLPVRDLQLFAKRYRERCGACRYFAVGEYGEKSGRAHWHLILFGHPVERFGRSLDTDLARAWGLGIVDDRFVARESIGYVAGYTLKAGEKLTFMSRRPGIGLGRLEALGGFAAKHGLRSWPGNYSYAGRRYPLADGGLVAFKRGYLNAGGLPPVEESPDHRHFVSVSRLTNWGTRIQGDRDQLNDHLYRRSGSYGALKAKASDYDSI